MTCCGFEIISPDRAIAWCDSETYVDGAPSGHGGKMAVNPFSLLVGVGTGGMALIRAAGEEIGASRGFDHAEIWIPPRLKQEARRLGEMEARIASAASVTIGVVGFSARLGRLVGAVIDHHASIPSLVSRFSSPAVDEFVDSEDAVVAAVCDQMVAQRETSPEAGSGAVLMAEINGATITVRPIFDLARGVPIRSAREFSAATSDTLRGAVGGHRDNTDRGRLASSIATARPANNSPRTRQ